jgi:Domain of unknown function (DUF4440)
MSSHRNITIALAFVLCGLLALGYSRATGAENRQAGPEKLEQHWLESEADPDALQSILADDFVHVLPFGFVSKDQQIGYIRSHPAPERGTSKHFQDLRIRLYGNTGIANGIVVATNAGGKVQKTIFTDVFVYRNGKWQAVNAQELPLDEAAHR